jgi:O-acetyl-ADP-ribose deacetylase (regulator of RNase III)
MTYSHRNNRHRNNVYYFYAYSSRKHRQQPTVENSRKLPYVYYKNKISIAMCDVSKGVGGLPRNEHMTFLVDKIDM